MPKEGYEEFSKVQDKMDVSEEEFRIFELILAVFMFLIRALVAKDV